MKIIITIQLTDIVYFTLLLACVTIMLNLRAKYSYKTYILKTWHFAGNEFGKNISLNIRRELLGSGFSPADLPDSDEDKKKMNLRLL